jgi:hypothetical protein
LEVGRRETGTNRDELLERLLKVHQHDLKAA